MKITYSSELMKNFKLADIAGPEKQFTALQTDDGRSLLFSVGGDRAGSDHLYVTEETHGHETGWVRTSISEKLLADLGAGSVKTFAVAQNAKTNGVDLVLVVSARGTDRVYLSLGNSATDTAWIRTPTWVEVVSNQWLSVVGACISQAADGQYIVVDVARNPNDSLKYVQRYYLDTNPARVKSGEAWRLHAMPVDLDVSRYRSCLGRSEGQKVDGIYTLGSVGDHDTLVYQPLFSRFHPDLPTVAASLYLPIGSAPSAIASVIVNESHETDLYVAGQGALYCFPSGAQRHGDSGVKVLEDPVFDGVTSLFAFATSKQVVVWGLNRAQQIFYTTCDRASAHQAGKWSLPLPILDEVEKVSPYVNRTDDGHVFFAHAGGALFKKATQSVKTTSWKFDNILLPLPENKAKTKAKKFSSYVTRIQVTDDQNQPVGNVSAMLDEKICVSLSSDHRVGLFINNRYTILTPTPLELPVDATGGLMIVEWVENLEATVLHLHRTAQPTLDINPMDKPLQQAANLDSDDKVKKAVIRKSNGQVEKPLVDADEAARKAFVNCMTQLKAAHEGLSKSNTRRDVRLLFADPVHTPLSSLSARNIVSVSVSASGAAIMTSEPTARMAALATQEVTHSAWGDFVQWLKSAAEYVFHLIEDVAGKVWHFVVEIAGKVFRFVLDGVHKIVNALEVAFQWVKTAIQDVINFLSFLFAWDDIRRTKDVFKQLLILSAQQATDDILWMKGKFDQTIRTASDGLDDWAGLSHSSDWTKRVNGDKPASGHAADTDMQDAHSAPSQFLTHHFTSNAGGATFEGSGPAAADGDLVGMLKTVLQAFEAEGDIFSGFTNTLKTEVIEKIGTLTVAQVLKKVLGLLADVLLQTTKVVGDLVFDLVARLVHSAIGVLNADVYIPIVSDILEDVFGMPRFSILDVLCFVGAVPATIIYKLALGEAPFSANDGFSDKVIGAKDVAELHARFGRHSSDRLRVAAVASNVAAPMVLTAGEVPLSNATPIELDYATQRRLFISGHAVSGILAIFVLPLLTAADVALEEASRTGPNPISAWAALAGVLAAGTAGYARLFADPYPIKSELFSTMSIICTGCTIVGKLIHGAVGTGFSRLKGDRASEMLVTKIGSFWDCLFATVALAPSGYHFYELSQLEASDGRSAALIGETSNVCGYLARITEFAARVVPDPTVTKAVLVVTMAGLYVCNGVLQCAEAGVGGRPQELPAVATA